MKVKVNHSLWRVLGSLIAFGNFSHSFIRLDLSSLLVPGFKLEATLFQIQ